LNLKRRLDFFLWYLGKPPWDTGISPPELIEYIQENQPGTALDLGCGTGTNVITLAKHGWSPTGVDFSMQAIRKAKRKSKKEGVNIRFYKDDVSRLKTIDSKFDLVLDIGCFHSLGQAQKYRYMENIDRLLNEGGDFLLYGWHKIPGESSTGISDSNLKEFERRMTLIKRKDSTEKGITPSLWLLFKK
jgi:cyclopropane fatty-acyl-phospholipid synthase-like methyltransferase